jgi:hypothetical protein
MSRHAFLNAIDFNNGDWTAWLTWEDTNLHIPNREMPFEISREFRLEMLI